MKKRILSVVMIIAVILGMASFTVSAKEISVLLNDREISFDVPPIIINDRTMVPMRKIFEALEYTVSWDQSTQKITARGEQGIIVMYVGSYYITKNGNNISIDTPPQVRTGRTLVPLRAISESLGCEVLWNGGTVFIYTNKNKTPQQDDNSYYDDDYYADDNDDYPSILLSEVDNIGDNFSKVSADKLTDNYGNVYSEALSIGWFNHKYTFETLLDMKYTRFKATLYVAKGTNTDYSKKIVIKADGKIIYTSPEITKKSKPIDVDIDITGCNDFEIEVTGDYDLGCIGDAGFYR